MALRFLGGFSVWFRVGFGASRRLRFPTFCADALDEHEVWWGLSAQCAVVTSGNFGHAT